MRKLLIFGVFVLAAVAYGCNGDSHCTPVCTGLQCGPDPKCGVSCGICGQDQTCDENGQCQGGCTPDCEGKCCGDDGCQGTCPDGCTGDSICNTDACECEQVPLGSACPGGEADCPDDWPTCLGVFGETLCTKACQEDSECGEEGCCREVEAGEMYCLDADRCGTGQVDDPCPFGNVHEDAELCSLGLTCLGLAADGSQGDCTSGSPAECTSINQRWNPDCVQSECGASLCAALCGEERACPEGYFDTDVRGRCYCVPDREAVEMCIDPVNNIGCSEGNSCIPVGGALLQCVPEGSKTTGEPCGELLGACVGGHLCAGSGGVYTCMRICDYDAGTGCEETGGICVGLEGIDRWGVCLVFDDCQIENFGADCPAGETCTLVDSSCTAFRCYASGGLQEGELCTYMNDCDKGMLCVSAGGDPTCMQVCLLPDQLECEADEWCIPLANCPDTWGVCLSF
jgi:hypothetical protein